MMFEFGLRAGSQRDSAGVAALFGRARSEMGYLPQLHTKEEDRAFFEHQLARYSSLLAVVDEAIVGFAVFGDGYLHHLYVAGLCQGRGIGAALLREVLDRSGAPLELWVFQENAGARRFYEHHGFVVVETTDGGGNEERLPDVRYTSSPFSEVPPGMK